MCRPVSLSIAELEKKTQPIHRHGREKKCVSGYMEFQNRDCERLFSSNFLYGNKRKSTVCQNGENPAESSQK